MKKQLLVFVIACFSIGAIAQSTIGNGNLENWTDVGSNKEEPTNFNSVKNASGNSTAITFAPQSCYREDVNPHAGTYCAKITTGNALGQSTPGSMTTGRVMIPSLTASEGYIRTIPTDPNYNMPFYSRPDSLVVWYRYTKQGSDYPSVTALLHQGYAYLPEVPVNNNHPDSSANIIARAEWLGASASVGSWTRIAIPFVYVDSRTPDYILITLTSSANSGATTGSTLWVDDFEVIYNPTVTTGTINPLAYYVSATQGAGVSVPYTLTGTFNGGNVVTAELSDANGSFASPVVIGSVTSGVSGTINATIPANTATGTGYRIRAKTSSPALTASANNADISIILAGNSVASGVAQTIAAGVNGAAINVTETGTATSRQWKYATTSGGTYQMFNPQQTGTTYTPNFANAGTYYVVCVSSFPGSLNIISNEVQVNVVSNSIAPATSQSILVGVNGTQLSVTETPAGSWREWKYTTTSGSNYQSFSPAVTGSSTYTPNFNSAGTYYVICQSDISGVMVNSNEVLVSVGNATITTGTVSGSPFWFSPNAPDASVTVPFTTSGTFNNGNTFTAQLSDASGSFANPVTIGSANGTTSGNINASIDHTTVTGTGYRIRVISSNPALIGSDNGVNLVVDQFSNSVSPDTVQHLLYNTNGTTLSVTASQTATQEWKYSTTSGSGYLSFATAETGNTYTPNFATPGTYYVVAVSKNTYNDETTSNEVQIEVSNGTHISTGTMAVTTFDVSASMNAAVNVGFSSDAVFDANNVFTAQLSDYTGSFANPVSIGTLNGATPAAMSASIPGTTTGGTAYRIRVVSSNPAITGTDNGSDLTVNPFEISVSPGTQQNILTGANGNPLAVSTTQSASYEWQHSDVAGSLYTPFNPAETGSTYTPHFNVPGTYYVVCTATNSAADAVTSQDIVVVVTNPSGISQNQAAYFKTYWSGNNLVVDLRHAMLNAPVLELMNLSGQVVVKQNMAAETLNHVFTSLSSGMYLFKITDGTNTYTGKTVKQ